MFAPWCPTCQSKMLLGPRRVVSIERGATGLRTVLRCHCGTLIVWSADQPVAEPVPEPAAAAPDQPPMVMTRSVPSGDTSVIVGAVKLDR
jgi:hypothetical protein